MRTHENVVINRPIDEVWAFLTDLFNSPTGASGGRWRSGGPRPAHWGTGRFFRVG
jgi:hypothetical protein